MDRSNIGCATKCLDDVECHAAVWNESTLECYKVENNELFCDEDNVDSIKAFIGSDDVSLACQGKENWFIFRGLSCHI